jgi:aminoglycoside phosphotransferase (APT) family kinase protein
VTSPVIAVADPGIHRLQYERFLAATDPERMRARVLEMSEVGSDSAVDVLDAKFEPGRPAVVLYRVGKTLVHGTVPVPEDGSTATAPVHLARYPMDPGLPSLRYAESPECLARILADGGSGVGSGRDRVDGVVESRLLRYRPGRRATFEVSVHGATGAEESARFVAKAYHDPAKAAAVATEGRELAALAFSAPLVLARVLAHDPQHAIVVQEHLPGHVLRVDLEATSAARAVEELTGAATALAVFHGLRVSSGRVRSLERELRRFVARSTGVRSVDPPTGEILLDLARRLLALPLPEGEASLVHGDCKPGQFLLDDDRVALLDLDHCGLADPVYDVGNLVASLRQQAIQHSQRVGEHDRSEAAAPLAAALELGAAFVDAYGAAGASSTVHGSRLDHRRLEGRVEIFVAVSLMRKALRAFARDPRSHVPLRLVAEAHRGLDRSGGEHP